MRFARSRRSIKMKSKAAENPAVAGFRWRAFRAGSFPVEGIQCSLGEQ